VLDWVRRRFAAARAEVRRRAARRSNSPAGEGEVGVAVGAAGSPGADANAVEVEVADDVVAGRRTEGGSGGSARTVGGVVRRPSEVRSEVPAERSARTEVEDEAARQSARP
jgi:hypothetical protein